MIFERLDFKYPLANWLSIDMSESLEIFPNSIQLFHTFLCNSQNYHPRGAVDDPMHCCLRPSASGNSASGHPQHLVGDSTSASGNSASGHPQHLVGDSFDCCTERYEIVVLLPNSEDTCYWKYFLKFE